MRALFCFVQPVELLKRLAQNDVSFGRRVLHLQSAADHLLRFVRPAFLAQKVAVSELGRGVSPTAEIDRRLKILHRLTCVPQRHFRYSEIVVSLEISGEHLRCLLEMTQAPGW